MKPWDLRVIRGSCGESQVASSQRHSVRLYYACASETVDAAHSKRCVGRQVDLELIIDGAVGVLVILLRRDS